jgi:hypothetical protein
MPAKGKTNAQLKADNAELTEILDDVKIQLDVMTDRAQELDEKLEEKVEAPDTSEAGLIILRRYCVYLGHLEKGLTVGNDYDFELNMAAAKSFWMGEGNNPDDLD